MKGVESKDISDLSNKLFSAILLEQQKFNQVRPADPERAPAMKKIIEEYKTLKGKGAFFDYISSGRGHGPFSELVDGSVKYDLIEGIGVNLLGHSHPLYIRAHLEAATSDTIMCGNLLSYQEAYEATKAVVNVVSKNSRLKHFWYSCSGSFANDTALKLVWQKKAPRYRVLAFEKAFAGRSVATMDITYNRDYKEGMPESIPVDYAPHFDQKDPENSLKKTLKALDDLWKIHGHEYATLMIELIQGEGGFIYGTKEFYKGIFDWAKAKNLYIWVDEVQTFGRTKELFAYQMFGLDEYVDIVTIGKALQACGTFYTEELNPKPGLIAGTFNGAVAALNMSSKVIRYLTEGNFYGENGRIAELERDFKNNLERLKNTTCKNKIGYIGGIGTMLSFEVGDSSKELTDKFLKQLFNNGVIAFSAGKNPTRVRFLLPLSITSEHIDDIFRIVEKTILETI